ncbi:MAG: Glycosyl hydrolase family 92 [Firmicutes bacterium ADurb.Bin262]|nr:MAG: Glycosyl hydrolase family 92 [Firmicutes bacterium ADurb.Bin262]
MLATIKKLQSLLLTLVIFLSAVFTTGAPPASVTMPDLKAGVYGRWVNPFIGTGGYPWVCAMLFPGAATPFGMVRLSPDTILPGGADFVNLGFAGYYYPYRHLRGFSHTRLVGAGTGDMGHFRVTPAIGNTKPADRLTHPLVFTHEQEEATAGYYAVNLPGIDCMAELTATTHAGVHRYTFRSEKDAHLFIDATSFRTAGSAADGKVRILPDAMEIEGEGLIHSNGGLKGYFVARFSKPFKSCATWTNGVSAAGSTEAAGDDTGADINFGNIKNEPVELKLGISFVSLENARLNLDAETGGLDFEGVRDAARDTWDTALSKIKIESPDREMKTIFYTALYHSMMMPTDFTDVNGQYLGFKEQAGTAEGFTYRTDMALWDTFRTLHPLLNLIAPDTQRDCLKSLVLMARANGSLPRWASESRDTGSMFGTPANMVIAESYLKGITDFEAAEAYAFMKNTALETGAHPESHPDIQALNRYGYVPADLENISVSKTLELSWAAGSIALLADALGNTEDAALFTGKSMSYKNIFNPATKYFQGRNADGSWQQPFLPNILSYYDEILPIKVSTAYCEGSPRQWRWTAPQDTAGLIALFGSREYFVRELNQFMADASKNLSAVVPGSGFWMGNGGTLSAWYVFSAMGLYPVAGTDRYWIGSPNVNKAVIDLGTGKTLTVKAENQSAENIYVQSVTLNGVRLTEPSIVHAQIAGGGTMTFVMGPAPAVNGGF